MALIFYPEPTGDEQKIRGLAREFTDAHLRPFAIEDDEKCRFRREAFDEAAKRGLTSLLVPKHFGGQGLSARTYYGCLEEIARGSLSMAVTLGVTNLVQGALISLGSDRQKKDYLPRLASGEWLGAFSLSEAGAGSDAASLRTVAKKVDGGYRVTGTKMWCSNGGYADLYLLMARTGEHKTRGVSSFLVRKGQAGFRIGKQENKLGLRASSLAELIFEDCFVKEEDRVGQEGDGLAVALSQLDGGRITIGTIGIGAAIEAIERVWRHHEKHPTPTSEGVRLGLAGYFAEIAAVRALITAAALAKDEGRTLTALAAQAKLLGSDIAMKVASDAVEWMGEKGYTRAGEVERILRDVKALQIVEGTNQIQRVVLARQMEEMLS